MFVEKKNVTKITTDLPYPVQGWRFPNTDFMKTMLKLC